MTVCLVNQPACGRVAGNPVCPKCGINERVVYPGQADLQAALQAAQERYVAAQKTVKPAQPPAPPKPPTGSEPLPQLPKQPDPEPPVNPDVKKKGITLLGLGVLAMTLLGGGWWWKVQQDQRVQQAEEQAASQALAVEQARSELEAEKKRADEAEAKRIAAEKAQAQMAEKAAEAARQAEADRAAQEAAREKQAALLASKAAQPPSAPPLAQLASVALLHGRYQILAGGSEVKDVQTGLTWARCSVGQAWNGSNCAGQANTFTFDQAQKLSGNGWRLPTVRELASLIFCSSGRTKQLVYLEDGLQPVTSYCVGEFAQPTIHSEPFSNTSSSMYWSSSISMGSTDLVWGVLFYNADVYYANGGRKLRLVRASR